MFNLFNRKRPARHWHESRHAIAIERDEGIIFFIKKNVRILNPRCKGIGLAIVKPVLEGEPDAAYLTQGVDPTHSEVDDAERLYCEAFGVPREGFVVLPAYYFRGCVDRSPENLAKLKAHGAAPLWADHEPANE